jgi:hypothetical protein
MVAREWILEIDEARASEFESFARGVALPFVRGQMGCAGVMVLKRQDSGRYCLLTLWVSRKAMLVALGSAGWEETSRGFGRFGADLDPEHSLGYDGVAFFLAGEKPDAPSVDRPQAP